MEEEKRLYLGLLVGVLLAVAGMWWGGYFFSEEQLGVIVLLSGGIALAGVSAYHIGACKK